MRYLLFTLGLFLASTFPSCVGQPNTGPKMGPPWQTIPIGENTSLLIYDGESFGFGPHHISFYKAYSEDTVFVKEDFLYNDGASLGNHNFELTAVTDSTCNFILKGEEQPDQNYYFKFDEAGNVDIMAIE